MSAQTLPDAVLQQLRGSAVAAMVGDTFSPDLGEGTIRIGFDYLGNGSLPYIVIQEPQESRGYFTRGGDARQTYLADGSLLIRCFTADRLSIKSLASAVALALNDAPLVWGDGDRMMHLRATTTSITPLSDVGSDSPTAFLGTIMCEFTYQGAV